MGRRCSFCAACTRKQGIFGHAAQKSGILLTIVVLLAIIPSLTVVKLKKVLQASIYAACETFLLRNEL